MKLRQSALSVLLKRFGSELNEDSSPKYSNESIYSCVHDWVSQGNVNTNGIVKYYQHTTQMSNSVKLISVTPDAEKHMPTVPV